MKPTIPVHFTDKQPDSTGLWLCRRNGYIHVLQIDQSDLNTAAKNSAWLHGEWGGHITLVDIDMVPLLRKPVQDTLDGMIRETWQKKQKLDAPEMDGNKDAIMESCLAGVRIQALQDTRLALFGAALDLP